MNAKRWDEKLTQAEHAKLVQWLRDHGVKPSEASKLKRDNVRRVTAGEIRSYLRNAPKAG